jgi:hypothetical protein
MAKNKNSKTGQPSLNRYQRQKLDLIKKIKGDLDQNKVKGSKLDFYKN